MSLELSSNEAMHVMVACHRHLFSCSSVFRLNVQEFYKDVKDVDRDNEVKRIISAFRLNPFEQLGLRYDATEEDIRRQYRKLSLLVHPDKCRHPQAKAAFEIVNSASKQLQNEDFRKELLHTLNLARGGHFRLQICALFCCYEDTRCVRQKPSCGG